MIDFSDPFPIMTTAMGPGSRLRYRPIEAGHPAARCQHPSTGSRAMPPRATRPISTARWASTSRLWTKRPAEPGRLAESRSPPPFRSVRRAQFMPSDPIIDPAHAIPAASQRLRALAASAGASPAFVALVTSVILAVAGPLRDRERARRAIPLRASSSTAPSPPTRRASYPRRASRQGRTRSRR